MKPDFRELYAREMAVVDLAIRLEERGMSFDYKMARRKNIVIQRRMKEILPRLLGIKPLAHAKVKAMLLQLGATTKELTIKNKISSDKNVLARLHNLTKKDDMRDFIEAILDYRALAKISGTYLKPISIRAAQNNCIVHCSINTTNARTGRPSVSEPNLLNIPRVSGAAGQINPVRECFPPRLGYRNYYFDYAAMEVAIFGLESGDSRITDIYTEGLDIHAFMAEKIFDDYAKDPKHWRQVTKAVTFGFLYGQGVSALAFKLKVTESTAKEWKYKYGEEFPTVYQYQDACKEQLKAVGYVADVYGRRYSIPVGQAYKAVNALIQGSCAQIFKTAMLQVDAFLLAFDKKHGTNSNMLLPVYDEVQMESDCLFKAPQAEMEMINGVMKSMIDIPQMMKRGFALRVDPCYTDLNWANKVKIKLEK